MAPTPLQGMPVAILVMDHFEQSELTEPRWKKQERRPGLSLRSPERSKE